MTEVGQKLQQVVFSKASRTVNNQYSRNIFKKLTDCHTGNIGVHHYRCESADCGHEKYQFHSCGNRHCPNCGGTKRDQWIADKEAELLPTAYYHIVFTLPHELDSLIMGNRVAMFNLLFEASSYTLLKLGANPKFLGARPGIISVLHTWSQTLSFHPHIHCIVSGGGENGGEWVKDKSKSQSYLFPKPMMQKMYKAVFLKKLRELLASNSLQIGEIDTIKLIDQVGKKRWNVYAKKPFSGPKTVLEYLGRYTHKTAITPHRILEIDEKEGFVRFKYKDYHHRGTDAEHKEMPLSIDEFIRRFEQHILPFRYVRIRHYGYLQNHGRAKRLKGLFEKLNLQAPPAKMRIPIYVTIREKYGIDIRVCPKCNEHHLELIATHYRSGATMMKDNRTNNFRNKASPMDF